MITSRKSIHLNLLIPAKKSEDPNKTTTVSAHTNGQSRDEEFVPDRKIQFKNLKFSEEPISCYLSCETCSSCSNDHLVSPGASGMNRNHDSESQCKSRDYGYHETAIGSSGLTGQVYYATHLDSEFAVKKIDVVKKSKMYSPEEVLAIFKETYNKLPTSKLAKSTRSDSDTAISSLPMCGGTELPHSVGTSVNDLSDDDRASMDHFVRLHKLVLKNGSVYAVLDHMNAGSLLNLVQTLHRSSTTIPERVLSAITYQILLGLRYIHGVTCDNFPQRSGSEVTPENIYEDDQSAVPPVYCHGNLKTSNILLSLDGWAKMQDSGARIIRNLFDINQHTTHKSGNHYLYFQNEYGYLAPDDMKGSRIRWQHDIWSIGVILTECCLGEFPIIFHGTYAFSKIMNFARAVFNNEHLSMLDGLSTRGYSVYLKDFIVQCLNSNPEERPSAEQLLRHKFITDNNHECRTSRETVHEFLKTVLHPPDSKFQFVSALNGSLSDIDIITQ